MLTKRLLYLLSYAGLNHAGRWFPVYAPFKEQPLYALTRVNWSRCPGRSSWPMVSRIKSRFNGSGNTGDQPAGPSLTPYMNEIPSMHLELKPDGGRTSRLWWRSVLPLVLLRAPWPRHRDRLLGRGVVYLSHRGGASGDSLLDGGPIK